MLGTSVGAINGVAVAAEPTAAGVERLTEAWCDIDRSKVFDGSVVRRLATLARTRTHLHSNASLLRDAHRAAPGRAGSRISRCRSSASRRASSAPASTGSPTARSSRPSSPRRPCPDCCRRSQIGGEHFIDGGIVNSIPLSRAIALGAREVYVLHVGRLDRPLEAPRSPWEVALVAFEIARRHRFVGELAAIPDGIDVHVLATGQQDPPRFTDRSQFRYRDTTRVARADRPRARGVGALPRRARPGRRA